jgi:uncharacterized membrane protein YccC
MPFKSTEKPEIIPSIATIKRLKNVLEKVLQLTEQHLNDIQNAKEKPLSVSHIEHIMKLHTKITDYEQQLQVLEPDENNLQQQNERKRQELINSVMKKLSQIRKTIQKDDHYKLSNLQGE